MKSDTRKTQLPRNIIFAGWNFCKSSIICHNESFFLVNWHQKKDSSSPSRNLTLPSPIWKFSKPSNQHQLCLSIWRNHEVFFKIYRSLFKTGFFIQKNHHHGVFFKIQLKFLQQEWIIFNCLFLNRSSLNHQHGVFFKTSPEVYSKLDSSSKRITNMDHHHGLL